jgi:hypothetical protein
MKRILTTLLTLISLQTYAVDKAEERLECIVQLTPEQIKEVTSIGIDTIKSEASNLDPKALNMLGMLYLSGVLVGKNEELGFDYIKQAAELGRPGAVKGLFTLYFCGLGTEADDDKGIEWLEKHLENLVYSYDFDGNKGKWMGSKEYVDTAYALVNKYISSVNPKHKLKIPGVIDILIKQASMSVTALENIAAKPEMYRSIMVDTKLTDNQIFSNYNQRAKEAKARLDELLAFKANN